MATHVAGLLQGKGGKSPQGLVEDTQVMDEVGEFEGPGKGEGKKGAGQESEGAANAKAKAQPKLARVGKEGGGKGGKGRSLAASFQHEFLDKARADQLYVI